MSTNRSIFPWAALGAGAVAGAALLLQRDSARPGSGGQGDSAPGRTARRRWFGDYAVTGKTVTIAKPGRAELYRFWRDFTNLPAFMENLEAVEMLGEGRSRWHIRGPLGTVTVESEIVAAREGELIAWRSVAGSEIDTEGRVAFRDAPGDRGTQVELVVAYKPPMGSAGRAVATLLQREPEIQARRDLRRFKMLMETGEIATSTRQLKLEETA
ncbi:MULTISPECIES: SRPBCC family protein [unclassified Sphingomonas]|uniref:SRPBCC family protein n=1 Tax=unclassified Sphingomonas TaxID=196159 RepID=UPI000833925B|nr:MULTISPECIES: SRPBCC family protein [unclassified Sphingomonas]MCH4893201.1 cyclase [Sphingomonas sp. SFZ2018-12]